MSHDQPTTDSRMQRLQEELTQPTIRLILAVVILLVIRALLVRVPGVDAVIYDESGITVATVLYTAVTLVIFAAVIRYASTVGATFARNFEELPEAEQALQLVGALVVLVWAYGLFGWVPYFNDNPVQYDYVFLILGIGFGGWLGYILYTNVDKYSKFISDRSLEAREDATPTAEPASTVTASVKSAADESTTTTNESATPANESATTTAESVSDEGSTHTCPDCGTEAPRDAAFCSSCGTDLETDESTTQNWSSHDAE